LSSLMRSLEAWTAREIAASPVLIDFLRLNDSSEEIRAKVVVIVISHFQKSYGIDLTPEEYFDNLGVKVPQEWIQYGLDSFENFSTAEQLIQKVRNQPMKSIKEMIKEKMKNKCSSRLPEVPNKVSKSGVWCKTRNDLTKHHKEEKEEGKSSGNEEENEEESSEESISVDEETFKIVSKHTKYQVNLMNRETIQQRKWIHDVKTQQQKEKIFKINYKIKNFGYKPEIKHINDEIWNKLNWNLNIKYTKFIYIIKNLKFVIENYDADFYGWKDKSEETERLLTEKYSNGNTTFDTGWYIFARNNITKQERRIIFNPNYQFAPMNAIVMNSNMYRMEITIKMENWDKETLLIKNETEPIENENWKWILVNENLISQIK